MLFAAILATISLCFLFNSTLLVRYYEYQKTETLGEVFDELNKVLGTEENSFVSQMPDNGETVDKPNEENSSSLQEEKNQEVNQSKEQGQNHKSKTEETAELKENTEETDSKQELSEEEILALDILCTQNNVSAVVAKNWLEIGWDKKQNVTKYVFGNLGESKDSSLMIFDSVRDYLFPGASPEIKNKDVVLAEENYCIYSMYDNKMNSNFLELYGQLDNGDIVLLRSNIESMQESVGIANKFLLYIGMVTAAIVAGIMFFFSKSFTEPIRTLSGIAKKMSHLDFDVKYKVKTKDEIGELGESINSLAETLEKTISELKSANNELQSDNERKTQIDEMRKEFLSNVTHELKTPIALIQGYAEGLKDNISEDAESREFYCDVIIDEAVKMNAMVQKLLTLNQLEFGNTPVEMTRFNLTELVASVLGTTDILRKQKNVTIQFEEQKPMCVWADEYLIEEVLTNYISNAFHHVFENGMIAVKLIPMQNRIRVCVFNTGEPIPEEELDKIWIKFYKVDKARTREYGGTGIGLSIVKAILESHNQKFGVVNRDNGVEFWFELDSCLNTKKVV